MASVCEHQLVYPSKRPVALCEHTGLASADRSDDFRFDVAHPYSSNSDKSMAPAMAL